MRVIQIAVPEQQHQDIVEVLREQQLGYTMTDGSGEQSDHVIINFAVPVDAVEYVLTELEETGFDRRTYTVSLDAEFANFEHVDEVQNRWMASPNRIAPIALRSKAKDLRQNTRSYVWMMVLSAVVATAGLLLSSPAVIVGSMVIAPIVSPVLTASVGVVRNDRNMFFDSVHQQALGLGIAIVTATVFGLAFKQLHVVPATLAIEQLELVSIRLSPGVLALVVGVAAGAAGAYGLATKGSVTLVGVMIAAALIPTAASAGLGFAWGNWVVGIGATFLLTLSMIGVNAGAMAMLVYLDYRPDDVDDGLLTYDRTSQALVIAATLLLVLTVVVITGFAFSQQSSFEHSVNTAVTDVLDQPEYEGVRVMSTSIEYHESTVTEETTVTLTLARTSEQEFPELPDEFARSISERTDEPVVVQVQYVDLEQSDVFGSPSHSLPRR